MGHIWSVIGAAVLLAIVGALVWSAYRYTRLVRLIEQTPVRKIADLAGGAAAIQGSVVALKEMLEAPLSRRRCVAFSVELRRRPSGRPPALDDVFDDRQSVVFAVDDGTGRAEIDLTKFTSIWLLDRESSRTPPPTSGFYPQAKSDLAGDLWKASDHIKDRAIENYGGRVKWFNPQSVDTWSRSAPVNTSYGEAIIEEGDPVFALGPVSVSNGRIQFTEIPGTRTILVFGTREDYLTQFRKSRRTCWWASVLVPTVAVFAYVSVRAAGWI